MYIINFVSYIYSLGGSLEITVHKQAEDGTFVLFLPSGDNCGGISVDDQYEKFLESIGGKDIIKAFAKNHTKDYLIMQREFEMKKQISSNTNVKIGIPESFHNLLKEKYKGGMEKALTLSIYKDNVNYSNYTLSLLHEVFKNFLLSTIQNVSNLIEQTLQKTGVKVIIMVGGFADFVFIRESILDRFQNYRIGTPTKAGLAVLKGAVYLGHIPNTKSSRVQSYTYR